MCYKKAWPVQYAAYKVTNNVKKHYAVGLGVYDVFINTNKADIYLDNAIEVPNTPGVLIENACIVEIASGEGPKVGINHIINDTTAGIRTGSGQTGGSGYGIQRLLSYCNGDSISLPDEYINKDNVTKVEEDGEDPTYDNMSEKNIVKEPSSKDDEKPLWDMTDEDFEKKAEDCENKTPGNDNSGKDPGDDNGGNNPGALTSQSIKVGQTITKGKYQYRVTKVTGKSTALVSLKSVVKKYRKNLKKAAVKGTVVVGSRKYTVTSIGKNAFKGCKKLNTVTVGSTVKKISAKAFVSSTKLRKVIVKGKKLKLVAKNAFNKKARKKIKVKAKKSVKTKFKKALK